MGTIQQCSIFSNSLCPSHFRLRRTLSGLHTRTRRYLVVSRLQTVYHASTTTQRPMTFISRWTRRKLWKTRLVAQRHTSHLASKDRSINQHFHINATPSRDNRNFPELKAPPRLLLFPKRTLCLCSAHAIRFLVEPHNSINNCPN